MTQGASAHPIGETSARLLCHRVPGSTGDEEVALRLFVEPQLSVLSDDLQGRCAERMPDFFPKGSICMCTANSVCNVYSSFFHNRLNWKQSKTLQWGQADTCTGPSRQ